MLDTLQGYVLPCIYMIKKTNEQLINTIIGQLNGVKRMLGEKRPCVDVLIQVKAIRSALNSLTSKMAADTIMDCASPKSPRNKIVMAKLIKELTDK